MSQSSQGLKRIAVQAFVVAIVEAFVWYTLPVGLKAVASVQIRFDQQIALASVIFLGALVVYLARNNQIMSRTLREVQGSNEAVWDFCQIHNEKKVLTQKGSREIVWEETFGDYHTLKIRIDANPGADVSIRTICRDLMLHDLQSNRKSTSVDAYEVMAETATQFWEREVRASPGRWFVVVSIPHDVSESSVYLEVSDKRSVLVPTSKRRKR